MQIKILTILFYLTYGARKRTYPQDLIIKAGPLQDQQEIYTVFTDKKIHDNFNMDKYPLTCCTPNNLTVFEALLYDPHLEQPQIFDLPIIINYSSKETLDIIDIKSKNYYGHQKLITKIERISPVVKTLDSITEKFIISHVCPREIDDATYWSIIEIQILLKNLESIEFQYQFQCDIHFHPNRFDWSSVLMVLIASGTIFFLARFGKLFSFKILFRKIPKKMTKMVTGMAKDDEHIFQGFFLSLRHSIIYIVLMTTAIILSLKYQDDFERIFENVVMVVISFLSLHFIDECLCQFKELKSKILWRLRIRHLYSLSFAFIIMALYLFWEKSWFLSDILSIFLLGSLVKLYKFISLKDACLFLVPNIIMDFALFIYVVVKVRYEWDSVAIRYFNTPLFFQFPYFVTIYKKKCAWISIVNILLPGFFIGLTYRFDQCKRTLIYEIISFLGLIIGMLTWLMIQSIYSLPLPVSLFTSVPMILLSSYFAWRRHEINTFWTGQFYDSILLEPFKNELDEGGRNSVISLGLFASKNKDIEMKKMDNRSEGSDGGNEPLVKKDSQGQFDLNSGLFKGLLFDQEK